MTMSQEFKDFLVDMLDPIGPIDAKRMFGGGGLFLHGNMFALIDEDVLYFKVDDGNRQSYDEVAAPAFTFTRANKKISLSYRQPPAEVIDDADALCHWAEQALQAAQRSASPIKTKKRGAK